MSSDFFPPESTFTSGGAGIAQWLERRTRDRKVPGSSPGGSERRENFLLKGQLSVLTLISVSVPPRGRSST